MSVKQVIKMPDFEADQQDAMKKTDNIQSLADQVERLETLQNEVNFVEILIFLLELQVTEYYQFSSLCFVGLFQNQSSIFPFSCKFIAIG